MPRLVITLICGLIVVPTALAASRASGDGVLELRTVNATVQIGSNAQPAQGTLWGQMDNGKLRVNDPVAGDGQVLVSGWEKRYPSPDNPRVVTYTGHDLHFRVTGGKYKLWFQGNGIDLTAVGVGIAYLDGDTQADDAGDYAVNGGKWIPVPVFVLPTQSKPVPFGDSTATP